MLVASYNGLVAAFALFLFFSFTEISQTRGNQPRNRAGDTLQLYGAHKSRSKRVAQPTSFSPTTDDVDLPPIAHGASTTLSPMTAGTQAPTDQGNVECGRRKPGSRIVGGTNAQPGSWPWQVLIDFRLFQGPVWCGGSILTTHWIVTAAHCFNVGKNASSFTLTVGEHDLRIVEGNEQIIPIDQIIVHPNYNPRETGNDYDVALIKLGEPITFNNYVRPVCLPAMDFPPGTNCYATGWGATTEGGDIAQILQQAEVPLVSRDTCQRAYSDLGYEITERMRCAGFSQGGVDSCQGDSGGPLLCPSNNRWYLMGIVSWGVGCARPNRFGVYSDMWALKSWVQNTINSTTTA